LALLEIAFCATVSFAFFAEKKAMDYFLGVNAASEAAGLVITTYLY
jgi:hypothetical protein